MHIASKSFQMLHTTHDTQSSLYKVQFEPKNFGVQQLGACQQAKSTAPLILHSTVQNKHTTKMKQFQCDVPILQATTLVLGLPTIILNACLHPLAHDAHQILQHLLRHFLQGVNHTFFELFNGFAPLCIHLGLCPSPQIFNTVQIRTVSRPPLQ